MNIKKNLLILMSLIIALVIDTSCKSKSKYRKSKGCDCPTISPHKR
ncbi:MAG TPA: hypothetical protein PK995_01735 [Bacteroidia bacterium]|nr:hypothetical protein [Bacteroidia bacterium]